MTNRRKSPDSRNAEHGPLPSDVMQDLTRLISRQDFESVEQLNAFLHEHVMGRAVPHVEPANDRERAEDIVAAARQERSVARMRKRAAEALALDADCVAAHLLLAEIADTPADTLASCRAAIAAGERAFADLLSEAEVSPWLHPPARPYMIAKALYCELLWSIGDRRAAIAEAQAILRLNPNDNQGIRYALLAWFMQAGSLAEIDALLAQYPERSAAWAFGTALHRFRTLGPRPEVTGTLREAMAANPYVAPMLLGERELPAEEPSSYSPGDVDEAALYVQMAASAWLENPGAMAWLEATRKAVTPSRQVPRRGRRRDH